MTPLKISEPILPVDVKSALKRLVAMGVTRKGRHDLNKQALKLNELCVEDLLTLVRTGVVQIGEPGDASYRPASAIAYEVEDYEDGRVVLTLSVDLAA